MNWYELTPRDVAGFVLAIALVAGVIAGYFLLSDALVKTNEGFGPDWECSNPGGAAGPICTKRIGTAGEAVTHSD